LIVILLASPLRYVGCECLRACRAHARAHKLVLCPVFVGTLLAAVRTQRRSGNSTAACLPGQEGSCTSSTWSCLQGLVVWWWQQRSWSPRRAPRRARREGRGAWSPCRRCRVTLLGGACRSSLPMTWCFRVPFVATTTCREKWRRVEDKRLSQGLEKSTIGNPHWPQKPYRSRS